MPEDPEPFVDVSELAFPADGYTDSEDPWDPVFGPEEGISMHHVRYRPFTPQPLEEIEEEGTPLYDDIGDAFTMIADGEWHEMTLTNFGGTNETNEEDWYFITPEYPYTGVWGKFDANKFYGFGNFNGEDPWAGENVKVELSFSNWYGEWSPTADFFQVYDETFDADNPDFNKLDLMDSVYQTKGYVTLYGGNRIDSQSFLSMRSETGMWYVRFESESARFTVRYRITTRVSPPSGTNTRAEWGPCFTYRAPDVLHPGNTWSIVNGDYVQINQYDSGDQPELWNLSPQIHPPSFRLDTSDLPNGLYNLRIRGRWLVEPDSGFQDFVVTPVRNGLYVHGVADSPFANEQNWEFYTQTDHEGWWDFELDPQTDQPATFFVAPFFLVLTGDVIDVIVTDWGGALEVELLALDMVHPVVPAGMFDITRFERNPIGNEFQGALPEAMTGDIDAEDYRGLEPRHNGWIDWDMVPMQNGDVWVMIHEELLAPLPQVPPSIYNHYFTLRKYDAGSGDWTTVSTGIGDTWAEGDKASRGGVSMAYESESTFLVAWWEWTGEYFGAPNTNYVAAKAFKWHVARYNTSGGATELGSGQTMGLGAGGLGTVEEGWYPVQLEVSPTGSIYAFTVQHDDSAPSFLGAKVFCHRWTGGGWENTNLPQLSSGGYGEDLTAPESNVSTPIATCMGRADGNPNFPSAIYGYDWRSAPIGSQDWWDSNRIRTMQYNGSTWETHDMSTTYLDRWYRDTDLESAVDPEFSIFRRATNVNIALCEGRIYSVIVRFGNFTPIWDMYRMSEDFTEWEPTTPKHPMIVMGNSWWYQGELIEGVDGKPTWVQNDQYGYYYVVKLEDVGTGGFTVISDVNMPLYGGVYHSVTPRMKKRGDKLYLMSVQNVFELDWDNLAVFVFRGELVEDFDRTWKPFPEVSLTRVRFAAGEEIVEDEDSP